jgi:hypothetical protein
MSIGRDNQVKCGWCFNKHKLEEWNDLTYEKCTNREMKRAFTNLSEERAFLKSSNTFYLCPSCGKWNRGSQLSIVDTNDKRLLRLGGESVIKSID